MKSLDVVVLCKIFILQNEGRWDWTYLGLAKEVCLSVGETHASVKRLKKSHLFDDFTKSVIPPTLREFLIHGVKYAFPAEIGALERGVATSHSAPVFQNDLVQSKDDVYVWPYAKGSERGLSINPLSKSAPKAALKDKALYDFLALLDALRIGKAREKNIAVSKLVKMIQEMDKNGKLQR